jgi:hypothetical protein
VDQYVLYGDLIENYPTDGRSPADDYGPFNDVWEKPDGGLHAYLYRFLSSSDATFQHIAVWTIVQLLESGGLSFLSIMTFSVTDCTSTQIPNWFIRSDRRPYWHPTSEH